jgi:hypothetical protein
VETFAAGARFPAPRPSGFNATTQRRDETEWLVGLGQCRRFGIVASSRFKNDWPAADGEFARDARALFFAPSRARIFSRLIGAVHFI